MIRDSHVCPRCGHSPAFTRCWECGWTLPEEACTTDVPPSFRDAGVKPVPRREATESEIRLTISWANLASDNKRNKFGGKAHSTEYKAARDAAHAEAMRQIRPRPYYPMDPVTLRIVFCPPNNIRRDPNNLTKLLCDALKGVAYDDDSQIVAMAWERGDTDTQDPRAYVVVGRSAA